MTVELQSTGEELDKLNVWVVWCLAANPQNIGPVVASGTANGGAASPQPGQVWVMPKNQQRYFEFTIQPQSITDANADRPNLNVKNDTSPPGPAALSGGATKKWDVSRRIRIKHLNPAPTTLTRNQIWGSWNHSEGLNANTASFPAASLEVLAFPSDDCEGNDDSGVTDEDNNPYSDAESVLNGEVPATAVGKLASQDKVTSPYILQAAGVVDEVTTIKIHFGEFVRLEIGTDPSSVWYRVSDFLNWKVEQRFKKVPAGMEDNGSTVGDDNAEY